MKLQDLTFPLGKTKWDKQKTLSFLRYALGISEKPGPVAALEVGTHTLKLVEVLVEEEKRTLLGYWVKEISRSEGLTEAQRDKDLQQNVKAFLKEAPLSSKKIHLGFSSDILCIRKVVVPVMPREELSQALRWAIRSQLPFNADEAIFAFEVLEVKDKKEEVLVVAVHEGRLSKWVIALQEAGWRVMSVVAGALSVLSWMKAEGRIQKEDSFAWVDVGGSHTSLFILRQGKVRFLRDLEIGGETITQSLTQAIATGEGELKLTPEEAELLKRSHGFPLQGPLQGDKLNANQIISLMRPILERLANEIRRSLEYYREGMGEGIQKIFLSGGSAQLKNLTAFLSEKIAYPIEILSDVAGFHWDASRINEKDLQARCPVIACALGVAFEQGRELNLLPSRFRERKSKAVERFALRISMIALGAFFLTASIYRWVELGFLQRERAILQSSWKMVQRLESLSQTLYGRREVLVNIRKERPSLVGTLKEISNTLPRHAVLTRIILNRGTNDLQLLGTLFGTENQPTETLVGELILNFEKSPLFQEVKLISTQRDETYDFPANSFELVCRLKVP